VDKPDSIVPLSMSFLLQFFLQTSVSVALLVYSLSLQNKFCVGQFCACQKDLHILHAGTSGGVEMIGTLTLKRLSLCFWFMVMNPCFMTFDDFWKEFGFLWSFSWRQWHTLAWICFDFYSEGMEFVAGTVHSHSSKGIMLQ